MTTKDCDFVLGSAEQQHWLWPDEENAVTQPTSWDQQIQEDVSSCCHKMVLLVCGGGCVSERLSLQLSETALHKTDLWTYDLSMSDDIIHFDWKRSVGLLEWHTKQIYYYTHIWPNTCDILWVVYIFVI